MDLQDLTMFVHVAREEGFSRAAIKLRVAQSALSRRVGRLEHQLGVQLFVRHRQGAALTSAGELLLKRAEALLNFCGDLERELQSLSEEPTGGYRLAFQTTLSRSLAPLVMKRAAERFPRISLYMREGFASDIHRWISEGEIDLGVMYEPEHGSAFEIEPLIREPVYLIASAVVDGPRDVDFFQPLDARRLSELPLILPSRASGIRTFVERFASDRHFHPQIVMEADGINIIKGLVQAGLGYTLLSHAAVEREVDAGLLRLVPIRKPDMAWTLAIVHRQEPVPSAITTNLKAIVREVTPAAMDQEHLKGLIIPRDF